RSLAPLASEMVPPPDHDPDRDANGPAPWAWASAGSRKKASASAAPPHARAWNGIDREGMSFPCLPRLSAASHPAGRPRLTDARARTTHVPPSTHIGDGRGFVKAARVAAPRAGARGFSVRRPSAGLYR